MPVLSPLQNVSRETQDRLSAFADVLRHWNQTVNLVSSNDIARLEQRHIDDCLQWLPLLSGHERGIDLGSGAGFPGLIFAIAGGVPFDLVEADQRKAAFLREAARITNAPVSVHSQRIENVSLPKSTLVTARALASLDQLLSLSSPFLKTEGCCLFAKGRNAAQEIENARRHWRFNVICEQSRTNRDATMLVVHAIERIAFIGS